MFFQKSFESIINRKKDEYETPFILNEKLFPVHMRARDELVDLYNDPNKTVRRKYRAVLNNDVTLYMIRTIKQTIKQHGRVVIYVYGEGRIGKSWLIIALKIIVYEALLELGLKVKAEEKDGAVTRIGVYTNNYVETTQAVREASKADLVYIVHQDEHPKAGGSGKQEKKEDFDNCLSELSWTMISFFIASTAPPPEFTDLSFSVQVVARNPELAGGTALGIFHYPSGREKGYVMVCQNPNYPEVYADYENNIKPQRQAEVSSRGGAESAVSIPEIEQKAQKIANRVFELEPNALKLTPKLIGAAVTTCGEKIMTYGDVREAILYRVQKLFEEHRSKVEPPTNTAAPDQAALPSKRSDRYATKEARTEAREIKRLSKAWEKEFEENWAPKLFDRYIALTGTGEPDGIGFEKGDHVKQVVALENGSYPDVNQTTVYMGAKHGKEGGRLYREIQYARTQRKLGENVTLKLYFKEEARNKVYVIPIDLDEPRSQTIHFDTDPSL